LWTWPLCEYAVVTERTVPPSSKALAVPIQSSRDSRIPIRLVQCICSFDHVSFTPMASADSRPAHSKRVILPSAFHSIHPGPSPLLAISL
jgi:hypothetical protein